MTRLHIIAALALVASGWLRPWAWVVATWRSRSDAAVDRRHAALVAALQRACATEVRR